IRCPGLSSGCNVLLRYLVLDLKAGRPRPSGRGASGPHLTSAARLSAVHAAGLVLETKEKFMSWSERSVRYHKRQTDCAIRHAYARLATDAPAVAKFHELLHYARNRAARLLEAPVLNGHHP